MLREHGQMARDYPDVRANTIASFALGDYEWLLAFEADELHRIVDLMRELRASRAPPPRARGDPLLHRAAASRPRSSSPTCADGTGLSCRGPSSMMATTGMSSSASHDRVRKKAARPMNGARALRVVLSLRRGAGDRAGRLRRAGSASKRGLGSGRSAKRAVTSARVTASRARPRRSSYSNASSRPASWCTARGRERVVALAGPDADVPVAGHARQSRRPRRPPQADRGLRAAARSAHDSSGCRRSEIELMQ